MTVLSSCLGFPRVGANRELKWSLESYWKARSTAEALQETATALRRRHWSQMKSAGIDVIPSNDFSLYDHMLDMAVTVGAIPSRFRDIRDPLTRYFAMARGMQDRKLGVDVPAMAMTKWFDTNYHYIVPELDRDQHFHLDPSKILTDVEDARMLGIETRPVVPGPVTFLMLSRMAEGEPSSPLQLLDALLPMYDELLGALSERGVEWVQLDEPCLVLDLDKESKRAYRSALGRLGALPRRPRIMVTTYFGPLRDNLELFTESGCEGLHVDLVRSPDQLKNILPELARDTVLSIGVVDGRNIWRTHLDAVHSFARRAVRALGEERVIVAPSCSLLHVPIDLDSETALDGELKSWLAFAAQKLRELRTVATGAGSQVPEDDPFIGSWQALAHRTVSPRVRNREVRERMAAIDESMLRRASPHPVRAAKQQEQFKLPQLPTTTIGSFPQTAEVRRARAAWRAGRMPAQEYETFIKDEIRRCVEKQSGLGIDVLVHGEFERNDMVEFFGEQLAGFAFTLNGWVQSYGSRCVKPPIIYADVHRKKAMTVDLSSYAQSLTPRPVKGMLTGPITILQWSFVRDDQPRMETCMQVAMTLRDEVMDLEDAGISMIQMDEPAIREGLPLRKDEREAYLDWAVQAFRLATSGVFDTTQIHTHMCYSSFGPILKAVAAMDADVLSIEMSRSGAELLTDFQAEGYPNQVGPGVYDIHSPRVPSVGEMVDLLKRAAEAIPADRLWVNPDCGLKTRDWVEVEASLRNMVQAANQARASAAGAAR